jgi:hypothetical protein
VRGCESLFWSGLRLRDGSECKKELSCKNCCMWIWLCSGRKNDRLRDYVELAKIAEEQVIIEHA